MMSSNKVGLVLAGGGAKGAYQAGAVRYLAEIGLAPTIIAGTSIGALNGGVLASCPSSFSFAVSYLNQMWDKLGQSQVLRFNKQAAFVKTTKAVAQPFLPPFTGWLYDFLLEHEILKDRDSFFDPEPLEKLLRETINPSDLYRGTELWVTAFPALNVPGLPNNVLNLLIDTFRAATGTKSDWLCIQNFDSHEHVYNLLLASAALPIMFPRRVVNEQVYIDGGLADNVPLGALAARGCNVAIVVHLSNGNLWNRHKFPNQTIIEIRPQKSIQKHDTLVTGYISSLLDFSSERIAKLKESGYMDAKLCVEPILEALFVTKSQRIAQDRLVDSTYDVINDPPLL